MLLTQSREAWDSSFGSSSATFLMSKKNVTSAPFKSRTPALRARLRLAMCGVSLLPTCSVFCGDPGLSIWRDFSDLWTDFPTVVPFSLVYGRNPWEAQSRNVCDPRSNTSGGERMQELLDHFLFPFFNDRFSWVLYCSLLYVAKPRVLKIHSVVQRLIVFSCLKLVCVCVLNNRWPCR